MRKCINGRLVEMTQQEIEDMLAKQRELVEQIPVELRLEKLEAALSRLAPMLEKLIPGLSDLREQKQE